MEIIDGDEIQMPIADFTGMFSFALYETESDFNTLIGPPIEAGITNDR